MRSFHWDLPSLLIYIKVLVLISPFFYPWNPQKVQLSNSNPNSQTYPHFTVLPPTAVILPTPLDPHLPYPPHYLSHLKLLPTKSKPPIQKQCNIHQSPFPLITRLFNTPLKLSLPTICSFEPLRFPWRVYGVKLAFYIWTLWLWEGRRWWIGASKVTGGNLWDLDVGKGFRGGNDGWGM